MAGRQRSNPLALAVLALLSERAMHPYEMAATMRSRGQDQSIRLNYGSLYGVVESLVRRGLVEEQEVEREGRRPERTVYRLTDDGRTEVVAWLSELLGTPVKEFPRFEAGLALMGVLPPERVVELLHARVDALDLEVLRLDSSLGAAAHNGVPRVFVVEIEYERALVQADLAFTRALAADIETGTLEGVEQWRGFHDDTYPARAVGPARPERPSPPARPEPPQRPARPTRPARPARPARPDRPGAHAPEQRGVTP